jgi:hypothetical protein
MRRASIKGSLVLALALVAGACGGGTSGAPSSNQRPVNAPHTGAPSSNGSANVTRNPQVIVDALDAAGLALCDSKYNDLAESNIYGILGAYTTLRFFPHHSAVPTQSEPTEGCATANQPKTGAIEIDVYPSPAVTSAALREVGKVWWASWLYGNVAVVVDQTTPPWFAQQEAQVLDHLPGASRFG